MKQIVTQGIVLSRTNYGEADRILTVLTPDQGKIRLVAKGVRRIKSRMAGGIELFTVNDITYIQGRGELGTLISSRLKKNYGSIVKDVDRTMYAYDVLKLINKVTEDSPEPEYFDLLGKCLSAINDATVSLDLIRLWLCMQLLKFGGHTPNFHTDLEGRVLEENIHYHFSFDDMIFNAHQSGPFISKHIKLLRLAQQTSNPAKLAQVQGTQDILIPLVQLAKTMLQQHQRV